MNMGKSVAAGTNPVIKFQYKGIAIRNMGKPVPAGTNPVIKFQNKHVAIRNMGKSVPAGAKSATKFSIAWSLSEIWENQYPQAQILS